jgi:Cu(I)/Ag(I) efflux system membrane fusion protein
MTSTSTAPAPSAERRVLYYRNPMGLPDTSPVPKKDSMGMAYLPVYADEAGDPRGTVRINPGRIQTLGVRTEEVVMRPALTRTLRATGNLQFNERHLATVTTKAGGWIEHLTVAATGDPVKRGQVLAEIYAPDLVAAEEEYLIAARMSGGMTHGDGGGLAAASLQRLRALDVPEDEIARLRKTGKTQRRIAVRAPADGVVIEKPAQEGMRIEAGQPLYKRGSLRSLAHGRGAGQDLGLVHRPSESTAPAFPSRSFRHGRVHLSSSLRDAHRPRAHRHLADQVLRAAMLRALSYFAGRGRPVLSSVIRRHR